MLKTVLFCVTFSLALSACTSKELYNAGKANRESHCKAYVGPEREQCLQEVNQKSYEVYEQERQQVINGKVDNK